MDFVQDLPGGTMFDLDLHNSFPMKIMQRWRGFIFYRWSSGDNTRNGYKKRGKKALKARPRTTSSQIKEELWIFNLILYNMINKKDFISIKFEYSKFNPKRFTANRSKSGSLFSQFGLPWTAQRPSNSKWWIPWRCWFLF